ncbi:D-beta-hydroxybutyrate dehydrogenase, mitochondrial-like [Bacillus rossius redtenbacheri]|uniref:D-beta-hydroxybutyrate dehydrogenase, mitochondrial-like n=1 Tax=Bacillus rossius redtenbacheri TaxID=93214 RepID=UPI002FDC9FD9
MENTADSLYRAAVWGLQAGVVSAALNWLGQALRVPLAGDFGTCAAFLVGAVAGAAAILLLDTVKISTKDRAVFVTGCDSGFGHAMALRLADMGFVVFAGCLFAEGQGAKQLKNTGRSNIHVIQLDVTSDEQVKRARDYVTEHLPLRGLWGILNNAGLATFGYVEWVPISTYKKVMDVNMWGMIRMIQAFLPLLRKSKGRVVNIASALARQSSPNRSTYGISKYGVEALSDCLRFEMRRFGVTVAIIEPGNFGSATGIFTPESIRRDAEALWKNIPPDVQQVYTKEFFDGIIENMIAYAGKSKSDMTSVLDAMTLALIHRYPHPRYQPMEPYFKIRTWISTHLPEWIHEALYI